MLKQVLFAAGLLVAGMISAQAAPAAPSAIEAGSLIETVADNCGPTRWRGPGGYCHPWAFAWTHPDGCGTGNYRGPGGGCNPIPTVWGYGNNCPPGYWRGPWGHCRNTPYHGRLPGGGWQ